MCILAHDEKQSSFVLSADQLCWCAFYTLSVISHWIAVVTVFYMTKQNAIRAMMQLHQSTVDMSAFAGPATTFPYLHTMSNAVILLAVIPDQEAVPRSDLP